MNFTGPLLNSSSFGQKLFGVCLSIDKVVHNIPQFRLIRGHIQHIASFFLILFDKLCYLIMIFLPLFLFLRYFQFLDEDVIDDILFTLFYV